ncbi:tyrosine-type recombinase/integrase [Natranaerobius trueperi]|nr:site-specific integrase [Natranaerobius trueperi]
MNPKTIEDYARILIRFFNYFEDKYNLHDYRKINRPTALDDYMRDRIYKKQIKRNGKIIYLTTDETNITQQTAKKEMTVLQGFFIYLDALYQFNIDSIDPEFIKRVLDTSDAKNKLKKHKESYYGDIWRIRKLSKLPCIIQGIKWKEKSKYRRSFTQEEITILESNLFSIRNKCIFLCSLEVGARISEILTVKKKDFIQNKQEHWVLRISKSKSNPRWVFIPEYLRKFIQMYINTERKQITNNSSKYPYLFVSTKGNTKGDKISYYTYRNALKKSAENGYLDPKDICTHMARATKSTRMKKDHRSNEEILKQLGNKTELKAYIDFDNPDMVIPVGTSLYNIDIK